MTVLTDVVVPVLAIGNEVPVAFLFASVTLKLSCANTSWSAQGGTDVAEEMG